MTSTADVIIEKLHKQATAKVQKELEAESAKRITAYLTKAIHTLIREGVLEKNEVADVVKKYGLNSSDFAKPSHASVSDVCGGQTNNRC